MKQGAVYGQLSSHGTNANIDPSAPSADLEALFFHHSVELCHLLAEALALSIHVLVCDIAKTQGAVKLDTLTCGSSVGSIYNG